MKIGVRKSPHIETLVTAIAASGDELTSTYDTGADFYLCWGWPQAEQVCRDGARAAQVICIDAHPFALRSNPGEYAGSRIFQLGNWGWLAEYPNPTQELEPVKLPRSKAKTRGPVLVLGHVSSTEQLRGELVDVWYTPGGDRWLEEERKKPNRRFRPHPRMWTLDVPQPSLADDLKGCSRAVAWNSTASVHARLLGYPAETIEAHGWAQFDLDYLAWLRVSPADVRSGVYWRTVYRPWLEQLQKERAHGTNP
jgi:hypothetical protein